MVKRRLTHSARQAKPSSKYRCSPRPPQHTPRIPLRRMQPRLILVQLDLYGLRVHRLDCFASVSVSSRPVLPARMRSRVWRPFQCCTGRYFCRWSAGTGRTWRGLGAGGGLCRIFIKLYNHLNRIMMRVQESQSSMRVFRNRMRLQRRV